MARNAIIKSFWPYCPVLRKIWSNEAESDADGKFQQFNMAHGRHFENIFFESQQLITYFDKSW